MKLLSCSFKISNSLSKITRPINFLFYRKFPESAEFLGFPEFPKFPAFPEFPESLNEISYFNLRHININKTHKTIDFKNSAN